MTLDPSGIPVFAGLLEAWGWRPRVETLPYQYTTPPDADVDYYESGPLSDGSVSVRPVFGLKEALTELGADAARAA